MKRSIELHSLSESLDTSTPTGRFMLKVLGAINELEREQIGERTKAALAHKRGQGQKTGGDVPFGYDADANGNLTENSKEQAVIRQTRNLRTQGYGYKLIAKALNEKGFTTKRGKTFNHVTVKRILQRAA